jgi:hypothetical protein
VRTRRIGVWLALLLIPAVSLLAFQLWTKSLYGQGMLSTVPFVTIMNRKIGAGFYSDVWGPLPFALGPAPAEEYHEDVVIQRTVLRAR